MHFGSLMSAAALAIAVTTPVAVAGDPVAYKAAAIYTGSYPQKVADGFLVVRDGKVIEIAAHAPHGVEIVDLGEAVIVPGLVAADSIMAGVKQAEERQMPGADTAGTDIRALDEYDPYSKHADLIRAGVTTIYVAPGRDRLIGGRGAVVKLAGDDPAGRVLRRESDLFVNVSRSALNPTPKFEPPLPPTAEDPLMPPRLQHPVSLAGITLALRQLMADAEAYRQGREMTASERPGFDPILEGLNDRGSLDVRLLARTADEIRRALEIHGELFSGTDHAFLSGLAEGHEVADAIARAGIPAVCELQGWFGRVAADRREALGDTDEAWATPAALARLGVLFAIVPTEDTDLADLRLLAGLAIQAGLDPEKALESITHAPARILGVADRVGSLVPGRDADFVVLNGGPFALTSHVLATYVDGREVYRRKQEEKRASKTMVLRAGHIFLGHHGTLENGEILVENGVITELGTRVGRPPGVRVVDHGPDAFVAPGFIDGRSRLGIETMRSTPNTDDDLTMLRSPLPRGGMHLARAGVTSAVVTPARAGSSGGPIGVFHTSGGRAGELAVRTPSAIYFTIDGNSRDRDISGLDSALKKAKEYKEKWTEYATKLAEWEAEQAKKASEPESPPADEKKTEEKKTDEKTEEKKAEEKKGEGKKEEPATPPEDAVSGTWEGVLYAVPGTGDVSYVGKLTLSGSVVTGSFTTPMIPDQQLGVLDGSFQDGVLKLQVASPHGVAAFEVTVADEGFAGTVTLQGEAFQTKATRTAKPDPVVKRVFRLPEEEKKSSSSKSGPPKEPRRDEKLEPFLHLLAKDIALIVDCARRDEIQAVCKLAADYDVRLVLGGAAELNYVEANLRSRVEGVLLPKEARSGERVIAREIVGQRKTFAFRSESSDGARTLYFVAADAVRYGLSPTEALLGLTAYPAKMFGVANQVGSIQRGLQADFVVFSGAPFDLASRVMAVYLQGERVPGDPQY